MKKSVYSLVLMDDVVQAIDEMAYSMNTSRSNLINQILAERVSFVTPEMRMQRIFSQIENLMNSSFQLLEQPSDAMLSIRSPLKYKYKPTIKYSIELYRTFEKAVGKLKVSIRTQSSQLIAEMNNFFNMWQTIENKYLARTPPQKIRWEFNGATFVRTFYCLPSENLSDEQIANAIGGYINLVDKCIKIYFDNIDDPKFAEQKIENVYLQTHNIE